MAPQGTEVKTEPYQWVAMHGDGDWTVRPVTSGTRVSLVFGIYGVGLKAQKSSCAADGGTYYGSWYDLLDSCGGFPHARQFIEIAKYLQPKQDVVGATKFEIDARFLNEDTLSSLAEDVYEEEGERDLHSMFCVRKLSFRPTKLQVRTENNAFGQDNVEVVNCACGKDKGYLGTLVVTQKDNSVGESVRVLDKDGVEHIVCGGTNKWYAVAAGGTSTVDPVTSGNRLSLHYDIYDATPDHDPLSMYNAAGALDSNDADDSDDEDAEDFCDYDYNEGDDGDDGDDDSEDSDINLISPRDSLITRTTVSERVRSEVLAAVEAELIANDALVISLQHVYTENQHNKPSYLKDGDLALYNALRSEYDLRFVEPLHSAFDTAIGRNKIVSGTLSTVVADNVASTKLIVPITLNSEHQSGKNKDTYTVSGLRVTKRMQ